MERSEAVIVIPVLNEAGHIGELLDSLLANGDNNTPIWVYDGGSTDRTREIVAKRAKQRPLLRLFDNPGRSQAHAVNLAAHRAAKAKTRVLLRLDAHASYPKGFAEHLINCLKTTGADSVVVPLFSVGRSVWQTAAADLQNSWLGNGGAAHRNGNQRGWVDHGHHAAFRLHVFLRLGGYDTRFIANEDAEYDYRLTRQGGRIFLENRQVVRYLPRATPVALAQQMYRNGFYRLQNARIHRVALGLRQQLPSLAALTVLGAVFSATLVGLPGLLPLLAYLFLVALLAIRAGGVSRPIHSARIAVLAVVSHMSFAAGVFRALSLPLWPQHQAWSLQRRVA